jgi:subtilisin family serine protease
MHQGEGVVVGVFDTSPFDNEGDGWETVEWVNPAMYTETLTMTMRVSYPEVVNTIEFSPSNQSAVTDTEALDDVRDHGLFVAGLIHAVAPASEIHLIKVLNEDGCGDLFLLNEALAQFTNEVEDEATGGVVINLSLGVHDPEENVIPVACSPEGLGNQEESDNQIESLCTTLSSAYSGGAVIVAAAGNRPYSETVAGGGSGNNYVPQPAQIPAAYDFVIGVRASNVISEAACFSNEGDLLAPGGEGDINNGCTSNVDGCSGNCEFAVIGPVLFPPQGAAYWPTRYAYWSGTSFSAPLVSGLAALLLETRTSQPCVDCGEGASPQTVDWVTGRINCGTSNGSNGVINVPHTLIDCLP